MDTLHFNDVENSLFPFRNGRRLVFDRILEMIANSPEIKEPALFLSRLFVRLKSADSILEKIRRKNLPVQVPADIPVYMDDILGFRLIVENRAELRFVDRFLTGAFKVKSVTNQPQNQQFDGQSIEYSLVYEHEGQSYSFEVQLRTFLQHYWAGHSFFLFHKTDANVALPYRDDLIALSHSLEAAEEAAERIQEKREGNREAGGQAPDWQAWPIRSRVHLMLIKTHEQFVDEQIIPLQGNDEADHHAIVAAKAACYEQDTRIAIVECMCANFAAFLLNEPQVQVRPEFFGRAVW